MLHEPAIRSTTVLTTVSFALAYSVIAVVLPVVYERLDQPEALGLLFVAFSGGGILGALFYSAVGTRVPRRPAFISGLVAAALVIGVFALNPPYGVQIVVVVIGGFMTGPVGPIVNVVLQERADEAIRGRALSIVFAFDYALYPFGYLTAGYLINAIGTTGTFVAIAAAAGVVAVWAMLTPALRDMEAPQHTA